jgi:hypothetical protein
LTDFNPNYDQMLESGLVGLGEDPKDISSSFRFARRLRTSFPHAASVSSCSPSIRM